MALSLGLALADETVTLKDGRKAILKDDGTYKYLDDEKGNQENDYPDIKMSDLKVDLKEMAGKRIRVRGKATYFSGMLMLGDPQQDFDISPIFVKIDDLPRDARKWIVSNCAPRCNLTVEGVVKSDLMLLNPGINAINVIHE